MTKRITLSIAAAGLLIGGSLQAQSAEDAYKNLISTSLFMANNLYLQTGWYDLDGRGGDDAETSNANFVGSYYFGDYGDSWRPFVIGGFGFSRITQDHTQTVGGFDGDVEFDSTYLKAGGGINYNPTSEISLSLGASGLWLNSDADYSARNGTGSNAAIAKYLESDSDSAIYDLFASGTYHTTLDNGYKPYFTVTAHYQSLDFDHGVSGENGFSGDFEAGVYTAELTRWMDLPVRAHFFAAATFLSNDLSDVVGFDSAYSAGTSLLWKIGPMIPIFDGAFKDTELAFNLQGTAGDSGLSGWKVSVSLNIAKFWAAPLRHRGL
ncbi:hypothetical protein [Nitratifractor sp.]